MPPPQLPADTPILNVVHPSEVGILPLARDKFYGTRLDSMNGGLCEFLGIHIPLRGQPGLYHYARPVATRDFETMLFNAVQ